MQVFSVTQYGMSPFCTKDPPTVPYDPTAPSQSLPPPELKPLQATLLCEIGSRREPVGSGGVGERTWQAIFVKFERTDESLM